MTIWRLKKGADRRFRQGHPWIFASELGHSAKEIGAGDVIELRDFQDRFLAFGYGHPSSQICFRRLSSRSQDGDVLSERFFVERLRRARELRVQAGWSQASHRWVYAEADGLPGLVIDAFLSETQGWLLVVQASTVGMDRVLPQVYSALETFAHEFGLITIVEAPSSSRRVLEGLKMGAKKIVTGQATELETCRIRLHQGLSLTCDLLTGQKTGFFLDQQWNAGILRKLMASQFKQVERPVRILDICCYVGQWAAHAAHAMRAIEVESEVVLLDASAGALALAQKNLEHLASSNAVVEGDAMNAVAGLKERSFDVVICDPPAFVKKKADLVQGVKAYAKLNRDAMRLVVPGGLFVASSCSGLVKSDSWQEILVEGSAKAGRVFKQLTLGGHAPDHPVRPEFPEGEYLKCSIGRIEYPY